MIISRTPLRVSFVGGGTDMAVFYRRHGGAVISTSINRYVYVTVNTKFDERLRISYSRTEDVASAPDVAHPIVRAVLGKLAITGGIEITSIADVPSQGTGLGSSSAFCVGLLNALHAYCGRYVERRGLAAQACQIEIDVLREPIGKQDQYASALGGLNYLRFNPDESVEILPLTHMRALAEEIQKSLLMFHTGIGRQASAILQGQRSNIDAGAGQESLKLMLGLVEHLRGDFERGNATSLGEVMHEAWLIKRGLADGVSSEAIDGWYARARAAGATGGKILGAGGGGFMLLCAPPDRHPAIVRALPELRHVTIGFERLGSTIVFSETNV
ncbi:MAG TPA: GHMP kinase [Xanthobacteraceae bacterium]|nr:GHMP kinase [Xanthobacteraceae bacterium]